MIDYKNLDMYKVGSNIENIIQRESKEKDIPMYMLFRDIRGWTYDSAAYYFRRNPTKIGDKFVDMILENFNCTLDDVLEGARNKTDG